MPAIATAPGARLAAPPVHRSRDLSTSAVRRSSTTRSRNEMTRRPASPTRWPLAGGGRDEPPRRPSRRRWRGGGRRCSGRSPGGPGGTPLAGACPTRPSGGLWPCPRRRLLMVAPPSLALSAAEARTEVADLTLSQGSEDPGLRTADDAGGGHAARGDAARRAAAVRRRRGGVAARAGARRGAAVRPRSLWPGAAAGSRRWPAAPGRSGPRPVAHDAGGGGVARRRAPAGRHLTAEQLAHALDARPCKVIVYDAHARIVAARAPYAATIVWTPRRGRVVGRDAVHANGGEGSSGTTRTAVFAQIRVVRTTTFTRCAAGRRRR